MQWSSWEARFSLLERGQSNAVAVLL